MKNTVLQLQIFW